MIYGHISMPETHGFLKQGEWRKVFLWLSGVSSATAPGIHEIQGDDIHANVQGYDTLPASQCRYESHERYVDVQYCISGGERIDCAAESDLMLDSDFDEEKDVQFFLPPVPGVPVVSLPMVPGSFAVFFPSDAHAPKRSDGKNSSVFKVIVKIDRKLVF